MLRGDREEHILFVSDPTITFLAIGLWNNERLKKTQTQRHHYIATRENDLDCASQSSRLKDKNT